MVSSLLFAQVHFPPYLFEAFLSEPVDDDRSTAKIGNGVALIGLLKRTSKVWEQLMITTSKTVYLADQLMRAYFGPLGTEPKPLHLAFC